jgi:hypothetical protein
MAEERKPKDSSDAATLFYILIGIAAFVFLFFIIEKIASAIVEAIGIPLAIVALVVIVLLASRRAQQRKADAERRRAEHKKKWMDERIADYHAYHARKRAKASGAKGGGFGAGGVAGAAGATGAGPTAASSSGSVYYGTADGVIWAENHAANVAGSIRNMEMDYQEYLQELESEYVAWEASNLSHATEQDIGVGTDWSIGSDGGDGGG